jgi:hypothetical protein
MRDTDGTWVALGAVIPLALASIASRMGSRSKPPEPSVPPLPKPSARGGGLKPRGEWYWQKGQAWAREAIAHPKRAPVDRDAQQLARALDTETAETYFLMTEGHFFRPAAWMQGRWVTDYAADKARHPKDNLDRLFWQGASRYASTWMTTWDQEALSAYHDVKEWEHFKEWKARHPRSTGSPARTASRKAELVHRVRKLVHSVRLDPSDDRCWLPDETEAIVCTNWARLMQRDLGGAVLGYAHADNPTAELGEVEGGHDFLLLDGRYIVDGWALGTWDVGPGVWDREDPKDAAAIRRLYGDPATWLPVPS